MLAVLYDIHGNLPALEAVTADAEAAGAEHWLLGGDYTLFGGWPVECVACLEALDATWIRGNGERWTADPAAAPEPVRGAIERCRDLLGDDLVAGLGGLPELHADTEVLYCHASPVSDVRSFMPDPGPDEGELLAGVAAEQIVFGHTHLPFERTAAGGIELLNPGSVGMPFDGDHRAAYALLHDDGAVERRRVGYRHEVGRSESPRRAWRGRRTARPPLRAGALRRRLTVLRSVYNSSQVASVPAPPPMRLSQVIAPRDREFFDLFEEAAGNILRAADLLDRMLRGFPDQAADYARDILICEQEGDRITHDIIRRLNETFVTPIDREDIYELASALDDIVDFTEEVADYLGLYKIEATMEQSQRQGRVLLECCRQVERGDAPPARVQGHLALHGRDQPARERRRPDHPRGDGLAVRHGHRPDGRDPLERHLRAPRGRDRLHRARGQHPRGHHHQELLGPWTAT